MALTIVDADNFTLTSFNTTTGITGHASNGPSATSTKPWMGFYNGQFARDTTTQETGNAAIKVRAHNNASAVANCKMTTRFKPRAADGTNRVLDGVHGLWRIRVDEIPDYGDGTAGGNGTGYHTTPGTILELREPTIANAICGVSYRQQGETSVLYVWHNGVSDAVAPSLWLGGLPFGQWLWLEGTVDLDHTSGTQARQAWRIIYPDGNPGRWVYDTWTRTHSSATDACFWTFGFTSVDTTTTFVRPWEYVSLDRYIIAESGDWWTKYDADGFGNDGLSPDLKIGFVVCDNSPTAISGAAYASAGTGAMNEIPSDASVANLRSSSTNGNSFRIGFSTSGTSYDTADLTDVGVVCAVIVKATMSLNNNDSVMDGEIGLRSSGGTVASNTCDVFSANWAEANSYGYASNVQPGGSTRWDASSTPMTDLAGMNAYIARGTTTGFLRVYDIGAYIVYRPAQTAPGATVGDLTATPDITGPSADCEFVPVEWRAIVEGDPYTVAGTDYTSVPVFAERSLKDLKVYTANWGVYPYETSVGACGTDGDTVPSVSRFDLAAGTSELVWKATATVAKTGSYTSTPPAGGPPATNGSSQWGWERWNGGTMAAYNMRPHRLCVDNWAYYSDGSTPNPWYGWVFVALAVANYDHATQDALDYNRPCHGILAIDTTRTYGGGDGVLCMARMIPFPANIGASSTAKGAFGISCNADEFIITRPSGAAVTQDVMYLLNKAAMAADIDGDGLPSVADMSGWWTTHTFGDFTSDGAEITNQTAYGAGKLWASGTGFYQCVKTTTNSFDSKRRARFGRGNITTFRYAQTRIWNASPNGKLYAAAELDSIVGATGDSRVIYGGNLQSKRSTLVLLEMTPGSSSADPTVTNHWRIPFDMFSDSPTNGEWRDVTISVSAMPVTNEDIFIVVHESYNSVGDDFFPRHFLAWFNTRRNEWREVRKPFANAHPTSAYWYLPPDAGGNPSPPSNRADMVNGSMTPTDDLYRFIVCDMGWPNGDYDYPPDQTGTAGNVASASLGAVYAGDFGAGPWRRESDIGVDFTIDLPSGVTTVDAWRVEVDGDGTLGSGLLVDGSNTAVTTTSGGTVTVHAAIPAHHVPDHASDTITVDVYWKANGHWSARAS